MLLECHFHQLTTMELRVLDYRQFANVQGQYGDTIQELSIDLSNEKLQVRALRIRAFEIYRVCELPASPISVPS